MKALSSRPDGNTASARLVEKLFSEHQQTIYRRTDRMFAVLMAIQWLAGIAAAYFISPRAWSGTASEIHPHVWAAIFLGGAISSLPVGLAVLQPGRAFTRYSISVGQMLMGALLIHLTGGRLETHFHVFGSLAFLAFYRDWRVLVPATLVVAVDHFLGGAFWPQSVYGVLAVSQWRWLEHAGWVIFEDTFLFIAIRYSVREMWDIAERTVEIKGLNEGLERHVAERTEQLVAANLELQKEVGERKQAEESARNSEARYRLLFDSNPLPMWVFDLETLGFLAINEAAIRHYGYSREEFMEMTIRDIRPPEEIPALLENVAQVSRGLGHTSVWKHRKKDGTIIEVEITAHTLSFVGRRAELVLANDITERLQTEKTLLETEEHLRRSQRMEAVGTLAGGVAHDFNNLLTVITGYSDLLLRRSSETDHGYQKIEGIKRAAERAAGLTRQLLAFSRKQVLQPKILDLNLLVPDTSKLLQRLIGENVQLVLALKPALGMVMADPSQIEQVVMNLVINARDAMPQGGRITIETSNVELSDRYAGIHPEVEPGRYVMLAVSDTGCGIDAETQKHIFEPFFTTKEVGKGTGLGLATVYGIVKQSGGNVWVYSEVGKGTTFKIYLPRIAQLAEGIEPTGTRAEIMDGTETILLVEDEDMVRELTRSILHESGYNVLEAAHGDEALSLSQQYQGTIHLLITDVVMPRMSGRELAEHLVNLRQEMKVLYMSGYTDDAIVHHGVLDKGMAFIEKPFTPDAMGRKVREVLDAHENVIA